jgi:hypothetical protein
MNPNDDELLRLTDAADAAYQRVRREVIDRIEPPGLIDLTTLDTHQRIVLELLTEAEAARARGRDRCYA